MGLISNNEYLMSFISKDYKTIQYAKQLKITVSLFGFRICYRPFTQNIPVRIRTYTLYSLWFYYAICSGFMGLLTYSALKISSYLFCDEYYRTVCPRSSWPFYIVAYYMKWVTILLGHTVGLVRVRAPIWDILFLM